MKSLWLILKVISIARWPPISYLEAMEEYRDKYGGDEDDSEGLGHSGERVKRRRDKCAVM